MFPLNNEALDEAQIREQKHCTFNVSESTSPFKIAYVEKMPMKS